MNLAFPALLKKKRRKVEVEMVVKVFGPVQAACPQRVIACLLELGVDFKVAHVDLATGQQKRPEFLLRQPFGQVPAIEDCGFKLFESRAIVRYLVSKYGSGETKKLLGSTIEERAVVDQWLEVEAHNFNEPVAAIVYQLVVLPQISGVLQKDDSMVLLVDENIKKLEKVLDIYEQRLSASKYLAGDSYSLADLSHLPGLRYIIHEVGLGGLVTDRRAVNAWWEDISGRPAWNEVLKLMAASSIVLA